jgi:flagellar assembly protein FliH
VKFNINTDRKIVGFSQKPIKFNPEQKSFDAEVLKKKKLETGNQATDKERIKFLNDRVNVLEQELQKAREDSFQAGFDEGKERGYSDASEDLEALKQQLNSLDDEYKKSIVKLEIPLLQLARKIAEKIIMREIDNGLDTDKIIIENVRKGLEEVIDESKIVIRLDQDQMQAFSEKNIKKAMNIQGKMDVNLVGDKNLIKGETIIESENFIIDGTYSAQLDNIQEQMIKEASE